MSNLENYMKQQAIFCEQNDSISKNLYSEYGVKRDPGKLRFKYYTEKPE